MGHVQLLDQIDDLTGAGAAEFSQQALDLGFHGDHLHTAGGGDLPDLLSLQQQAHQLPLGGGELGPIKTFQGTWKSYAFAGGHMSYGALGTGYLFEEKIDSIFHGMYYAVNPDYNAAKCVNEWWYPAAFWLQYYGYNAVADMCELIGSSHPNPDGSFSSSDALSTFSKERATRAMFAYLIDGAVADELEVSLIDRKSVV